MSAPQTDIEKQKRRHWAPLAGVALAVVFGVAMFLLWMFEVFEGAESPQDAETEMQETSPPGSETAGEVDVNQNGQADEVQPDEAQPAQPDEVQPDEAQPAAPDEADDDTAPGE